jgi:hypothetical protein
MNSDVYTPFAIQQRTVELSFLMSTSKEREWHADFEQISNSYGGRRLN